ncbi:MAG: flagellin, partial [Fibromonadaceae bacterium]|nr:flagellin [Fibromonadaceae bacterium]
MSSVLFNIPSMISQSKLRLHNKAVSGALEKLSTGNRVNSSKDDPTKYYEASNAKSNVRNNERAKQNAHESAAMLQIAEGACNEIHSILQRIRELCVQASSDTLTSTEREYLNIEVSGLLEEVDRIAAGTTYNSKQIFGNRGDSFSDEQRDLSTWKPFSVEDGTRAGILHIGRSNLSSDEMKITIPELSAKSMGLDTLDLKLINRVGNDDSDDDNVVINPIDALDAAINSLSTIRSYMGSLVNRLDYQVEDLDNTNINLNNHVSKIRDADFAKEST